MAVTGDVTRLPQDGAHLLKLHPHLVALVKWCVSCVWGVAAVLLRRLLELPPVVPPLPPLPPIAALVRSTLHLNAARRRRSPPRTCPDSTSRASSPHISAVPTVECEVLYRPAGDIGVDIIFVHGLYGSLANTWRQGRWRSKHKSELNKIPLKRSSTASTTPCSCNLIDPIIFPDQKAKKRPKDDKTCLCDEDRHKQNETSDAHNNEKFISHGEYDVYTDVKETKGDENDRMLKENEVECKGAQYFVANRRLNMSKKDSIRGKKEEEIREDDTNGSSYNVLENKEVAAEGRQYVLSKINVVDNYDDLINELFKNEYRLDINGCDDIAMVFNKISKNGAKFETENGDSALCDIYNNYGQSTNNFSNEEDIIKEESFSCNQNVTESTHFCNNCNKTLSQQSSNDTCEVGCSSCSDFHDPHQCYGCKKTFAPENSSKSCEVGCGCVCSRCYSDCWPRDWLQVDYPDARIISINYTSDPYLWRPIWIKESKRLRLHERAEQMMAQLLELGVGARPVVWVGHSKGGLFIKQIYSEAYEAFTNKTSQPKMADTTDNEAVKCDSSPLWSSTAGFMFYSVPHRGSPLADINIPPLVARSIELLEMGKDCSEVLCLQRRWLRAAGGAAPVVRSLVETCRTLMAVLWLRIVSVESADAGIGALCGVSLDHREICKPSSRSCLLYRELLHLIDTALRRPPRDKPAGCSCH